MIIATGVFQKTEPYTIGPYPATKESGVPWLGGIPAHWEVLRTKRAFRYQKEQNAHLKEDNVLSLTLRGVVNNNPDNPEGLVPKDYATYQVFEKDDLVFKLIDLENLRTSRVGLVHERGIMSPAYVRLSLFRKGDIRYYYHQFFDLYLRGIYNQLGAGVRATLGPRDLLDLPIVEPSLSEQTAIARYLDYVDRRVRRYIKAKRRLIEVLTEQKQAIIHQAVTRGLDPDVPMKESGVPWLGEVPAHWEVISVGAATDLLQTGPFGSQLHSYEYVNGGIPMVNPAHMKDGRIVPDPAVSVTEEKLKELERHSVTAGDIIAARRGELGRCVLVTENEEGWLCGTGSLLIRCKTSMLIPAYFQIVFSSQGIRDALSLSSVGATMENLNAGMVARLRIQVPPHDEQQKIVELIVAERKRHKTLIDRIHHEIDLLREYRTRLIADVVTGKVDVRGVAASLGEEAGFDMNSADQDEAWDEEEALDGDDGEEMDEEVEA